MRRKCLERFPHHRLQRKPLVSDPGMYHGTCVTHVPWCMPGSLTCGGGENVPGIPGACATCNFTYLVRGPCRGVYLTSWACTAALYAACCRISYEMVRRMFLRNMWRTAHTTFPIWLTDTRLKGSHTDWATENLAVKTIHACMEVDYRDMK